MAKPTSRYVCQACGEISLRWEGQCRGCAAWNTLVETVMTPATRARGGAPADPAQPTSLAEVVDDETPRRPTGLGELDRVLGGGLVAGSVVLLGGEPGIGKSTLLLQVAAGLGGPVTYASGEESAAQVRLRADRLGLLAGPAARHIALLADHDIETIVELARRTRPVALIVDSIQTATVAGLEGAPGSVGQVREATIRLMDLAKGDGIAVILVGHVTKDGSIAGPRTLEHLVDAVVSMEGERYAALRLVRAAKNRFGSTEEVGVFEMAGHGLLEVADPGRAFLAEHPEPAPGSVVAPTMEGTRPLLVEVQALVAPAGYGTPARKASGLDPNRLNLLVAVLGRRAGIALGSHDVYANVAGGLAISEPGLDLPIALALASSLRDRPIPGDVVAVGEVGLLGELRPVPGVERRLREAARLGFRRAIVPAMRGAADPPRPDGLEVWPAATLREAVGLALGLPSGTRGEAVPAMLG